LPFVRFGDSDAAEVGEWVMAIGNPFGLGASVSAGIISARNRAIGAGAFDDFLQTDAAINRGNSGGPLFNLAGEVIGVNTAIISPTGASAGVGFAAPSNLAKTVVAQILKYGEARRGWIGVRVRPVTPEAARRNAQERASGVLVTGLVEDGPAAKAGVRPGDVVVSLGGRAARDVRAFARLEAEAEIGKATPLAFLRGGQSRSVTVTVGRMPGADTPAARTPAPQAKASPPAAAGAAGPQGIVLGMRLSELTPDIRRRFRVDRDTRGLLVMSLEPGSPAAQTLKAGDVILELQFEPVETVAEARAQVSRQEGKGPVLLYIDRSGDKTFRRLTLR
jgi:serine protease Do